MIDFHNHIIYDVDDGAKTIQDSIKMLLEAEKVGITDIIATPHYMEEFYEVPRSEISKKIQLLNTALQQNNINIQIHQGNEIYITNNIIDLIEQDIASTMNNSKYVLFETPMSSEPLNLIEVIYKILESNRIPVIAHPERYKFVQDNPNRVYDLIQEGALIQANVGSIVGQYGKEAKKALIQLLENNMVHFIGTDTHRPETIYPKVPKALEEMEKLIGKEKLEKITIENPRKVINNEDINIEAPTQIRTGFFNKLFK